MPHGMSRRDSCGRSVAPADRDREARIRDGMDPAYLRHYGLPKLAVHTLASLAGSGWHAGQPPTAVVWSTFYDMRRYGGMHIFLHACIAGTSMVLSSAHESTAEFLARAGGDGVTHISGTPSHWRRALMSPQATRIAPVYVRMSGEIVDQAILNQVRAQYPMARVDHTFASTEAGVGFYVSDGLMGFPPEILESNPLIEMKVQDGTLRIRSNRTATRYLGENTPVLKDSEGFVDTGDTIETRDGRCYFTGRRDGIINVGGRKVHPEEVEAVINRHPGVAMSLVRAKKNPITGALVIADVVLKPESSKNGADLASMFSKAISSTSAARSWNRTRSPRPSISFQPFRLENRESWCGAMRNVIVTGGSRGLGLGIARKLIASGFRAIAVARKESSEFVAAKIEVEQSNPGALQFVPFDLADIEAIPELVKSAAQAIRAIYGLVNNAGMSADGVLAMAPTQQIEQVSA